MKEMTLRSKRKPRRKATKVDPEWRVQGYRSSLEHEAALDLKERGINFVYESYTFTYTINEIKKYTPDFYINGTSFHLEFKGWLTLEDRKKAIRVRESNPSIEVRFVFQNSKNKIRKGSKTTYGDWCDKNGFKYADKFVPDEWLNK